MSRVVEGPLADSKSVIVHGENIYVLSPAVNLPAEMILKSETYVVSVAPSLYLNSSLSFLCLHHLLSYLHFWQ